MQQVFIGCLLRMALWGILEMSHALAHSALGCVGSDSLIINVLEAVSGC